MKCVTREQTAREGRYNRVKLIEIHRDCYELLNSDVFCFGNYRRYIGNSLCWPIPMYFLDRFGPPYIGMGIETSIPMYRLLKLGPPYIGMALNRAFPMYVHKTIHSRYIGIQQEYQIPMYHLLQTYQIKQPAMPHTSNSKRIAARIIVKYIYSLPHTS